MSVMSRVSWCAFRRTAPAWSAADRLGIDLEDADLARVVRGEMFVPTSQAATSFPRRRRRDGDVDAARVTWANSRDTGTSVRTVSSSRAVTMHTLAGPQRA